MITHIKNYIVIAVCFEQGDGTYGSLLIKYYAFYAKAVFMAAGSIVIKETQRRMSAKLSYCNAFFTDVAQIIGEGHAKVRYAAALVCSCYGYNAGRR